MQTGHAETMVGQVPLGAVTCIRDLHTKTTCQKFQLVKNIRVIELKFQQQIIDLHEQDHLQVENCIINIDSKYVKDGITRWITTWKTNNYKTQSNTDVLNKGMWLIFDSLNSDRKDIKMKGSQKLITWLNKALTVNGVIGN